jgi:hypothetical protein
MGHRLRRLQRRQGRPRGRLGGRGPGQRQTLQPGRQRHERALQRTLPDGHEVSSEYCVKRL